MFEECDLAANFAKERVIDCARDIPYLSADAHIGLLRTSGVFAGKLQSFGAKLGQNGTWHICRTDEVALPELGEHLPRVAKASIVPNIIDLIPESSWGASLANILTSKSWGDLRDASISIAEGCEDCGSRVKLECHELWSYDEESGVQTLEALRSLCSLCHETYHLGLASSKGRFERAFDRLALINRITYEERAGYRAAIYDKHAIRSDIEWVLDLSLITGKDLRLKSHFDLIGMGVIGACHQEREIQVIFTGIDVKPKASGKSGLIIS